MKEWLVLRTQMRGTDIHLSSSRSRVAAPDPGGYQVKCAAFGLHAINSVASLIGKMIMAYAACVRL